MNKNNYKIAICAFFVMIVAVIACKKSFLDKPLVGPVTQASLANKSGVEALLIGAYSLLDGVGAAGTTGVPGLTAPSGSGGVWEGSADDWIFSSVPGGDDHKGSFQQDQGAYFLPVQAYNTTPDNLYLNDKWIIVYESVNRCNTVLKTMALAKDLSPADTTEIRAEAVFLRGIYHLEGKKMWKNIPYIDESIDISKNNYLVSNTIDAWPGIEADFKYAAANLPATQQQIGRANSWAAKAFLAKCYMFEGNYTDAYTLIKDIIANGQTSGGQKYQLLAHYGDNFNAATKNNAEAVFSAQMSVRDNAGGQNGNGGDVLNFPYGGPTTCCGFNQPSYSLANSFKTDPATGLPLLDNFNDFDIKSDEGIASWADPTKPDTFQTYTGTLDPRIDWSLGRRGIPYLDWGLPPGQSWIRDQTNAGPYSPIKQVVTKAQQATLAEAYGGWASNQATANNYAYIRFADVLLWAAECATEANDLVAATGYVNQVRDRNSDPSGWVHQYPKNAAGIQDPSLGTTNIPAANYKIGLYPTFASQDYARKAIRFERKIELSSEGMRFFDLVRWGIADVELNAYVAHETGYNHSFNQSSATPSVKYIFYDPLGTPNGALYGVPVTPAAQFVKGKSEYYAIPQAQIDASRGPDGKSSLTQNPGYN
ncbi:MAG TPA: RagB/SusD family nutrient uptake outer membrane protein [Puia sp.]|nr:RagB/SusD family nutrient uptake outer membrane protein [Puia sp.]